MSVTERFVSVEQLIEKGILVFEERDEGYFTSYQVSQDYVLTVGGKVVHLAQILEDDDNEIVLVDAGNIEYPVKNLDSVKTKFAARLFKDVTGVL